MSGPTGTSVTGRSAAARRSTRKSTACWSSGAPCAGGRSGPSRPLSPCTSAATRASRTSGRSAPGGDRDVGAADELEDADRVRGRLGERLVAGDGRHAEQLELGLASASRSAIASSWPGSQSRMIGMRRHAASIASTSSAVGRTVARRPRRGDRPGGAGTPERLLAVAALEQRDDEAGAERVSGGRPVDGGDGGRRRAGDLLPALEQERALGAQRDREERPERRRAERVELERVRDDQVAACEHLVGDGAGRRGVQADEAVGLLGGAARPRSGSRAGRARRRRRPRGRRRRPQRRVRARARRRSGSRPRRRRRSSRSRSVSSTRRARQVDAGLLEPGERARPCSSSPTQPTKRTSAPSRAAATAWFAPFPPGTRSKSASVSVSPGRGSRSVNATRSRLALPTTVTWAGARDSLPGAPGECRLSGERSEVVDRAAAVEVLAEVEEPGPEGRAVGHGAPCGPTRRALRARARARRARGTPARPAAGRRSRRRGAGRRPTRAPPPPPARRTRSAPRRRRPRARGGTARAAARARRARSRRARPPAAAPPGAGPAWSARARPAPSGRAAGRTRAPPPRPPTRERIEPRGRRRRRRRRSRAAPPRGQVVPFSPLRRSRSQQVDQLGQPQPETRSRRRRSGVRPRRRPGGSSGRRPVRS